MTPRLARQTFGDLVLYVSGFLTGAVVGAAAMLWLFRGLR